MKSALQIRNELDDKMAKVKSVQTVIEDEQREPTEDESKLINAFYGEDGQGGEYQRLTSLMATRQKQEEIQKDYAKQKLNQRITQGEQIIQSTNIVPAKAKRHGPLVAFAANADGEKEAYCVGRWLMAKVFNHQASERWLREHGMYNAQEETSGNGVELVPEPLEAAVLSRLVQLSNVMQYLRVSTMTSATLKIPDRLTGVVVQYPDENAEITPSSMTFKQQTLTARKMATLTQIGNEVNEDSVVGVVDMLANDIAYSLALKIEDDLVNGDGTATYGSVTGINASLNANSIKVGAGPASTDLLLSDYEEAMALNPMFQGSDPAWYVSTSVYANSMLPLLNASLGTPGSEVASGYQRTFLGYPVRFLQTMDKGTTVSTVQALFGTLDQSVYFGQRRGITIATSEHYGFSTDSIWVRGITRNAITVDNHDTSEAGPLTAVATAAS